MAHQISKRMSAGHWSLLAVLLVARTAFAERPAIEWMAGGHSDQVHSVVYSPDGQMLASGSEDYTIKLWRVSDGMLQRTLTGHTDWLYSVAAAVRRRVSRSTPKKAMMRRIRLPSPNSTMSTPSRERPKSRPMGSNT